MEKILCTVLNEALRAADKGRRRIGVIGCSVLNDDFPQIMVLLANSDRGF